VAVLVSLSSALLLAGPRQPRIWRQWNDGDRTTFLVCEGANLCWMTQEVSGTALGAKIDTRSYGELRMTGPSGTGVVNSSGIGVAKDYHLLMRLDQRFSMTILPGVTFRRHGWALPFLPWMLWPWIVPAAWLVPLAVRSRRRQRRMVAGHCPECGYDLRATPQRCPECGWESPPRWRKLTADSGHTDQPR
jgi:hypothetical protein